MTAVLLSIHAVMATANTHLIASSILMMILDDRREFDERRSGIREQEVNEVVFDGILVLQTSAPIYGGSWNEIRHHRRSFLGTISCHMVHMVISWSWSMSIFIFVYSVFLLGVILMVTTDRCRKFRKVTVCA